jgi:hypothetical protein
LPDCRGPIDQWLHKVLVFRYELAKEKIGNTGDFAIDFLFYALTTAILVATALYAFYKSRH